MSISFGCACGKQLKVADEFAGKRARCPACAGVVTVPVPPKPELSVEDAAFEMLTPDEVQPAPKHPADHYPPPVKPAPRQWEENADETPYRVNTQSEAPQTPKKSTRTIPKFESKKIRRREERDRQRSGIHISPGVIGGVLLMIGAVVWFVLGLAADRIFFYPPFMFIGGLVGVVKGIMGYSED